MSFGMTVFWVFVIGGLAIACDMLMPLGCHVMACGGPR
jgi:hypothetical protein